MLPFLKNKNETSPIVSNDKVNIESDDGKLMAAKEIIEAVNNKDPKALLLSIKSLFEMLEMEPHDEAEHE